MCEGAEVLEKQTMALKAIHPRGEHYLKGTEGRHWTLRKLCTSDKQIAQLCYNHLGLISLKARPLFGLHGVHGLMIPSMPPAFQPNSSHAKRHSQGCTWSPGDVSQLRTAREFTICILHVYEIQSKDRNRTGSSGPLPAFFRDSDFLRLINILNLFLLEKNLFILVSV